MSFSRLHRHLSENCLTRSSIIHPTRSFEPSLKCVSALFLGVLTLLGGCSKKDTKTEEGAEERVVTVDVAPVVNGDIQRKITANAVLFPIQQAAIVPKIVAPVKKFYVDRGSRVKSGQLLAELENQDLVGALAEGRANADQAESAFEIASRSALPEEFHKSELEAKSSKEAMEAQQRLYEGRQALLKEGAISAKEVAEAQVAYTQAKNQYEISQKHLDALQRFGNDQELKSAKAQLDAAKGKLQGVEAQLSYSKIVSPIDGVVTDRPIFPGETPQGGAPVLTVMNLSSVTARFHISQQEAEQMKVGDASTIMAPGMDKPIQGKVSVVSPALDANSTTVEVWVKADNPGERLKPGTSVQVEIVAETVKDTLLIPAAALLAGADGSNSVILVDANNKPKKRHVTTGIRTGEEVQITDGLKSGDQVVTTGAFQLDRQEEEQLAKTKIEIQAPPEEEDDDEDK
jgi:HlyD family secretion protein